MSSGGGPSATKCTVQRMNGQGQLRAKETIQYVPGWGDEENFRKKLLSFLRLVNYQCESRGQRGKLESRLADQLSEPVKFASQGKT